MELIDRLRKGMSVIVDVGQELHAGTVFEISPETQEVGVRKEWAGGEVKLVPVGKVFLSHRKSGEIPQLQPQRQFHHLTNNEKAGMLESYVVAIAEGKINSASVAEVAEAIKARGHIKDVRTQDLLSRFYR